MDQTKSCFCSELDDLATIGMGGLGERLLATLDRIQDHGGNQWWLYASTCSACQQSWMIAQEERVHDNYHLKRLDPGAMQAIVEHARWPLDFLYYEQVLRLGRQSGQTAQFLDPLSPALIETAKDLRRERPEISIEEIAYVLAISTESACRLLKAAA